jgi:hypothetical protein
MLFKLHFYSYTYNFKDQRTAMYACKGLSENTFSSTILSDCAKIEMNLANEALDHEIQVEQLVVIPLQQMLDNDVPKHKAKLSKFTLDMDSARARYLLLTHKHCKNKGSGKEKLQLSSSSRFSFIRLLVLQCSAQNWSLH